MTCNRPAEGDGNNGNDDVAVAVDDGDDGVIDLVVAGIVVAIDEDEENGSPTETFCGVERLLALPTKGVPAVAERLFVAADQEGEEKEGAEEEEEEEKEGKWNSRGDTSR